MFEITGGEDRATLTVSGEVTMQNALAFRDALKEWIEKGDTLDLNLGGVAEADLTCLQLICSAHRSLMNTKKTLTVMGELPESISKAAQEAGFVRERGCRGEESHSCIWVMRPER
ncbi:MAG: STAS domain-containing protein [Deltaproteobacteria bacterium]|nr:STAS domain-containing protein [Deltaproteobacteria bacterium]